MLAGALCGWIALLGLLAPFPARAHIVMGSASVRQLTHAADLVVRVRIVDDAGDAHAPVDGHDAHDAPTSDDARGTAAADAAHRRVVAARVLDIWKGDSVSGLLRFAQHGHGVPSYEPGDEVAVFLQPIASSRELAQTRLASEVSWVSTLEGGARFDLDDANRDAVAEAVRAYVRVGHLASAEARRHLLQQTTVAALASGPELLARSALRDLASAPEVALITATDLPRLLPVLERSSAPIGIRIALLSELERRELVPGPSHWLKLLRSTRGGERLAVVRAAAAHPSAPLSAELIDLLGGPGKGSGSATPSDPALAAAAAVSLGVARNEVAVAPLERLLASDESRLRMAAIRGLGRIATASATAALARTAAEHPDPATRRRAGAELKLLRASGR